MRTRSVPSFIQKTWEMLQTQQHQSILRWRPDGNSFQIIDEDRFCSILLPHYFKHSNFSSFIRQLNMYNFHKRKTLDNSVQFYHKLFRKDQKLLLVGIRRKPSEAEIQLGDQLIRKLAPDAQVNSVMDWQKEEMKQPEVGQSDYVMEEEPILEQNNRPVLCLMGWMINGIDNYNFNGWSPQKKIKTNIILKNPPSMDLENRGY